MQCMQCGIIWRIAPFGNEMKKYIGFSLVLGESICSTHFLAVDFARSHSSLQRVARRRRREERICANGGPIVRNKSEHST